jgi:hypothetical protein
MMNIYQIVHSGVNSFATSRICTVTQGTVARI